MAYYAILDENNVVTKVIKGVDETAVSFNTEHHFADMYRIPKERVKRCSFNTKEGVHSNNGVPFRKNYPGIGHIYDPVRDAFIPPKPLPSWVLNENTCTWEPPIPYPSIKDLPNNQAYAWDEDTLSYTIVTAPSGIVFREKP